MKVKAIIFKRDRQNYGIVLTRKNRFNRGFTFEGNTYMIDPDHFAITSRRILGFKRNYITFYYKEGVPLPLPVPTFPDLKNLGISTEELNAIFTPEFYRILAAAQKDKKMDIILYASLAAVAIQVYGVYLIHKLPQKLAEILGGGP